MAPTSPTLLSQQEQGGKQLEKMAIQYYSDIAILMSMHKDNMAENSMTLEAIFQAETGSSKKYSYQYYCHLNCCSCPDTGIQKFRIGKGASPKNLGDVQIP